MSDDDGDPAADLRLGPYTTTAWLESEAGLSGGAFGSVAEARHDDGSEAVAKLCRSVGGSLGNTVGIGYHHPDIAYREGDRRNSARHVTLPIDDVAEVLRQEAAILERAGGVLLPAFLGLFEYTPAGHTSPLPALIMERVRGHRPNTVRELVRIVERLADASRTGALDHHGDLKPEHIFIDDMDGKVRLVDPAPRLRQGLGAFTPEYNPYGLTGPVSDVFAIAVIAYELIAHVAPFVFDVRPITPFVGPSEGTDDAWEIELPPPVARGRSRPADVSAVEWIILTTFADEILRSRPDELPRWAFDYDDSVQRLTISHFAGPK